jgi:hypothetical protein
MLLVMSQQALLEDQPPEGRNPMNAICLKMVEGQPRGEKSLRG